MDEFGNSGHEGDTHSDSERGRPELEFPGRRSFLVMLVAAGTAFVGAMLAVPLVRFVTDPLFRKSGGTEWSEVGPLSDFANLAQPAEPVIHVEKQDGWRQITSSKPVFVMPENEGSHRVFSSICPHLGCQVEWVGDQKHFYCPCHGSVFGEDGLVVKGPAPRGLDYLDSKVEDDKLMVKYQYFRLLSPDREIVG